MEFNFTMNGVTYHHPCDHSQHSYIGYTYLGSIRTSTVAVWKVYRDLVFNPSWDAKMYNPASHNCHHFSEAFLKNIGLWPLPSSYPKEFTRSAVLLRMLTLGGRRSLINFFTGAAEYSLNSNTHTHTHTSPPLAHTHTQTSWLERFMQTKNQIKEQTTISNKNKIKLNKIK
eukprot:GHVR01009264.1.p1 GENE.GHVR01009264.1~~GHVR01009264.1.p1  ORF type:complete len:171 (+),score=52.60 GHVR01009264.1:386-898(+)